MLAALFMVGPAAPANPVASADAATGFRMNATNDGTIPDAGLNGPLVKLWSVHYSAGPLSSALIADGMVFATMSPYGPIKSGVLLAFNQATGSVVWSKPLGTNGRLAYDRGRVFVSSSASYADLLTAYDAATGSVAWSEQAPAGKVSWGAPTAANGIVYLGATGSGAAAYAIREGDGSVLWTQPLAVTGDTVGPPAVTAQAAYFVGSSSPPGSHSETLAFDPLLGTLLWQQPVGSGVPVAADGDLLVGDVSLSSSTGAVQGPIASGPSDFELSDPAVANNVAFTATGAWAHTTLSAVDEAGLGSTEWTFAGDGIITTAPIVAGGLVYVGDAGGNLYALDPATGATSWSTSVFSNGQELDHITAADGTMIVSGGGSLVAYGNAGAQSGVPANQSPPTVDGSGDLNEVEAADVGIWSGLPSSYTYQWELCDSAGANCADIPGATSLSYVPGTADYGQTLRVRVLATNGLGSSAPVESPASGVIGLATAPPESASAPVVSASPLVGQPLSTTNGTWTNSAISYAYQWQRCDETGANCADIPGATSSQYTPIGDDVGSTLRSGVLASSSVGPASTGYALSVPTGLVSAIGAPAIRGSANDEATAEHLDPAHDGHMADAGLSGQLTQAWSVNLGADVSYPLIAQGMVFATSLNNLTGSTVNTLTAIDQATGNIVWSAPVGTWAQPTGVGLAYDRGRVFVTDDSTGLTAFDAATGNKDWNLRQGSGSPPTAANGIVYVNTGNDLLAVREDGQAHGVGIAGSIPANTTITSVPVPDGTTAPVADGASITVTAPGAVPYSATLRVTANVAAGATSIPVASYYQGVSLTGGTIVDPSSMLWAEPVPNGGSSAPAVTDHGVYVSTWCTDVYDFDPLAGTQLWHRPSPAGPGCSGAGGHTPVVADGHVFVSGGFDSLILSASTGSPQGPLGAASSPAVANGVLFTFGDSTLNAIAADGLGALNWSVPGNSSIFSTSALAVGGDVFGGTDAGLSEFDAATGATVWSAGVGPSSLAASNGTLVVAAGNSSAVGQPATLVAYRSAGPITDPPTNQAQPSVEGAADLSGLQAADVGVWSGLPSAYSYQWELCDGTGANCADIAGATGASYLPPPEDVGIGATLRVRIVATNAVGASAPVESLPSVSSPLVAVAALQPHGRNGRVADSSAGVGQTLSTTNGIWTNDPTGYTYKWQRCDSAGRNCADIAGQTSPTYTLVSDDAGHEIRSEVRASNGAGKAVTFAPSPPTSPVDGSGRPHVTGSPLVSGTALVGSMLTTTAGTWTNTPTSYAYRWQRCNPDGSKCVTIANATGSHYTVAKADLGFALRSEVLATNAVGASPDGYAPSARTSPVPAKPAVTALPKISGTAKVGNSLSVSTGTWKNFPTSYAYQWFRCNATGSGCKKIAGATSSSYPLVSADAGHKLKAKVTASNAAGSATATSKASAKVQK